MIKRGFYKLLMILLALTWSVNAYAWLTINSVTVDGSSSTSVSASGSVSVAMQVTTGGSNGQDDWRCTRVTVNGVTTNVDHGNHNNDGVHSDSFNITAPSSTGTFDLQVQAYRNDSCNGTSSSTTTLSNAITVSSGGGGGGSTCSAFWPSGLQNTNNGGEIKFKDDGQLRNDPDGVLQTTDLDLDGDVTSCQTQECTQSGSVVTAISPGSFKSSSSSYDVDRSSGQNFSLGSDGRSEYDDIKLESSAGTLSDSGNYTEYKIDKLEIEEDGTIILQAGTDYWIEELKLDKNVTLTVQGSGTARIYVDKDLKIEEDTLINSPSQGNAGDASKLFIYAYDKVEIEKNTTVSAFIHAEDDFKTKEDSYLFGAASGRDKMEIEGVISYSSSAVGSLQIGSLCGGVTVSSIARDQAQNNGLDNVSWTVTFSESVTGVNAADFQLVATGLTGTAISGVTGSGTTWTVTASTGSGDGTLGLNLVDDNSIINGSSDPLGGSSTGDGNFTGEVYTITKSSCVTFRDNFSTRSYSNSDGTASWLTNWTENELSGSSAAGGYIEVLSSGKLEIRGGKSLFGSDTADQTITRSANLSGRTSATLTFDYEEYFSNASEYAEDYIAIEVRKGSGSWVELARYRDDAGSSSESFDITSYIDANTQVRFYANGALHGPTSFAEYMHFDNFQIEACTSGNNTPTDADSFNAVHSTSGNRADGELYTRIAGVGFEVDVVALNSSGTIETAFADQSAQTVSIELVEYANGVACDSLSLLTSSTPGDVLSANVVFATGSADSGRKRSPTLKVSKAYQRVMVRIKDSNGVVQGCSNDTFSIRPSAMTLVTPAVNSASPPAKAGNTFDLAVDTIAGYTGTPTFDTITAHAGGAVGSLIQSASDAKGVFGAAVSSTGRATGTFRYSEVGTFSFPSQSLRDTAYTSQDATDGDCLTGGSSYENSLQGASGLEMGKVGCYFANSSATTDIGRFTPDHFTITVDQSGVLENTCVAGSFSYAGTNIPFSTNPSITITAKNGLTPAGTTTNYKGAYLKLDTATPSNDISMTAESKNAGATSGYVGLTWNAGSQTLTSNNNGTLTFALSGDTFTYGRAANDLIAPFNPNIDLKINSITDDDGVTASGVPVTFNPDAATNTVSSRYGRVTLMNAFGSELQTLSMMMQVQYYKDSTDEFVLHTDDVCSTGVVSSVVLKDNATGDALSIAGPTSETCVLNGASCYGSTYNSGSNERTYASSLNPASDTIDLKAPGAENVGVLQVTISLPAYLQYDWTGTGNANPTATATFGINNLNESMIFIRDAR